MESLEPDLSCPCSCSCAGLLYSAYGERTAPCRCPLPFISERVCRWPWSLAGDEAFTVPFAYDEGSGVYCDDERPWLCVCEVGAIGSAYVDAIRNATFVRPLWGRLDSVKVIGRVGLAMRDGTVLNCLEMAVLEGKKQRGSQPASVSVLQ